LPSVLLSILKQAITLKFTVLVFAATSAGCQRESVLGAQLGTRERQGWQLHCAALSRLLLRLLRRI